MRQWLLVILPAVALLGLVILVGVLINLGVNSGDGDEVTPSSVPAAAIGNAVRGEQLWTQKGCSMCHSYGGQGGTDAPPLDYMPGDMSIEGIAGGGLVLAIGASRVYLGAGHPRDVVAGLGLGAGWACLLAWAGGRTAVGGRPRARAGHSGPPAATVRPRGRRRAPPERPRPRACGARRSSASVSQSLSGGGRRLA